MSSPLSCMAANLGQRVQAPGGLGGECVDWANIFLAEVHRLPPVHANAVDWRNVTLPGFTWVANTPFNAPGLGSLVVWHAYPRLSVGPNGHIAVAVSGDSGHFIACDQNWPEGSPVALTLHAYGGVAGWLAPAG